LLPGSLSAKHHNRSKRKKSRKVSKRTAKKQAETPLSDAIISLSSQSSGRRRQDFCFSSAAAAERADNASVKLRIRRLRSARWADIEIETLAVLVQY
jgi:hypothetical protein